MKKSVNFFHTDLEIIGESSDSKEKTTIDLLINKKSKDSFKRKEIFIITLDDLGS